MAVMMIDWLGQDGAPERNTLSQALGSIESEQYLKRGNIVVAGHRTSVRLEPSMWEGLREISHREKRTMAELATLVASRKPADASLTSALRVFVLAYHRVSARTLNS